MQESSKNLIVGISLAILASISFALMSASVKIIGSDVSVPILIFFRFIFSFFTILPLVLLSKKFQFKVNKPFHYAVRILTALAALALTFKALTLAPLTSVLLLGSTAPLFIPLISFIFLRTKTHLSVWISIAIGFIGVAIVLNPSINIFSNIGSLLALGAGFLAAIAFLEVRILSKTDSSLQILFYYYAVGSLISGIVCLFYWQWPSSHEQLLLLVAVGLFGTIYQVAVTVAIAKAPARIVTPLAFLSVIWAGVIDKFMWNINPSLNVMIGFFVILIGIIMVLYFGYKHIINQDNK
ncbi:MAG: DMT family transporter [Campylobacterota bacterium]|nr:DMT family transporter [Campylobacterota bacterium]